MIHEGGTPYETQAPCRPCGYQAGRSGGEDQERHQPPLMKLKPLADRVVIKLVEAEEKTKSGISLPL